MQLQQKNTDPVKIKRDLQIFENEIQKISDQMDTIVADVNLEFSLNEGNQKRSCAVTNLTTKKREAIERCDFIILDIRSRFSFTGHLVATNLFSTYGKS